MRVEVIDLKTGKSKLMPEKHARVLVKLKRARWPDPVVGQYQTKVMEAEKHVMEVDEVPEQKVVEEQPIEQPEQQPAIIKRGRKPKFRG
jgi:hypothetical protein